MAKSKTKAPEGVTGSTEVEFEHPDTGQAYGASFAAFQALYEPLGYKLTRKADGSPLKAEEAPESGPEPVLPKDEEA
jgi:hypothetical protein